MTFKPLLAGDPLKKIAVKDQEEVLRGLKYPLLASPKLDGIRVVVKDGVAMTRSLKPVRNRYVQSILGNEMFNGFDGEIVAGSELDPMAFRRTTTAVMAEESRELITYWIFDNYQLQSPFKERLGSLAFRAWNFACGSKISVLQHKEITDYNELLSYEEECLQLNFEGVMLRDPNGKYKFGRSTSNEGILLKLKRGQVQTGEAVVVGFTERVQNNNEAFVNELGYQKRSVHKENLIGRGDLGSLQVKDCETGNEFSIGSGVGLDDSLRSEIWNNQESYLGKIVRYEWFAYGAYDLPRFPKFVAFRDPEDMS